MQIGICIANRVICDANSEITSQITLFSFKFLPFPRNKERAAFLGRIVNFGEKKEDILAVGRWRSGAPAAAGARVRGRASGAGMRQP